MCHFARAHNYLFYECNSAHPSHADTVLVIDTREDVDRDIISELPIHRATCDTNDRKNYKWLGGSIGADGNIYCPACDTSAVLKINVTTDHCETFGFTGNDKNKWQGGILGRDNCIYCIPANGFNRSNLFKMKMAIKVETPALYQIDLC